MSGNSSKSFFAVIFLYLFSISNAQITSRNLLEPYSAGVAASLIPRNEWKPFPQTAEGWRQLLPETVCRELVKRGEDASGKEFRSTPANIALDYVRNGNRSRYEAISFEKRNMLYDLVLAESIEGKGRFTDRIIDGVWSICEESFWGVSAHLGMQKAGPGLPDVQEPVVDLFAAETAAVLAWTDYFAGAAMDRVSKLVRKRISFEVDRRVLTPMTTARYSYLGNGDTNAKLNNWAPWVASNYLAANLLLEANDGRRAEATQRAMQIIDQYMNGLGDDGSTEEGPSYWFAAGACVFDGLNLLNDATKGKINIYNSPFLQQMGAYIYKTHIDGDYFINVADANPSFKADGLMLYRFGTATNDVYLQQFAKEIYQRSLKDPGSPERFFRSRSLYNLLAITPCGTAGEPVRPVADVWLPGVEMMASRSNKDLFVATHGGHNGESHNHNDIGDFIVYAKGYPVIIDAGRGTYTSRTFSRERYSLWFNTSAYHNLPRVNGFDQADGKAFAATSVSYKSKGNTSQLEMDIAGAYPREAGIVSWKRTVRMDKTKGVEVTDKFAMESPVKTLSQYFMTVCDVDLSIPGTITFLVPGGDPVRLTYDAKVWKVSREKIELTTPEDRGFASSWAGKEIYRLTLTASGLGKSGILRYVIR